MKYRPLGKTGMQVSEIGVGAWQLGGPLTLDGKADGHPELGRDFCIQLIRQCGDLGISFVDTAEQYGNGESERRVGQAPRNLTLNRAGGNRWTAYNWENNASNAGSDWGPYSNDDHLSSSSTPAEAVRQIIAADRGRSNASLITVQMQGYVAADKSGKVDVSDPNRLATRFKQVVYQKRAPFTNSPSSSDAYVYMDEFLWTLRSRFTNDIYADPVCPTFVSLDNEPELWNSTHFEIQPQPITPDAFIQKSIRLSQALKAFDPKIQALVQSPRSLWDPTYREDSWIADYFGGPIHILDRIQSRIATNWPGIRLAIREYANGGDNHIAGAIAQADNLGIFGSHGLFAAACYPTSPDLLTLRH